MAVVNVRIDSEITFYDALHLIHILLGKNAICNSALAFSRTFVCRKQTLFFELLRNPLNEEIDIGFGWQTCDRIVAVVIDPQIFKANS